MNVMKGLIERSLEKTIQNWLNMTELKNQGLN